MKRILVVEPDLAIRETMKHVLMEEGYAVNLSDSSEGALSYLFNEANEKPHLILTELLMPDMDGLRFIEKLKNNEKLKEVPVLVVATNTAVKVPEGMPFLQKPFVLEDFIETVKRYCS